MVNTEFVKRLTFEICPAGDDVTATPLHDGDAEEKNPDDAVVGVDDVVSSLSEMHRGLELPLRLGPAEKCHKAF